MKRRKKPRPILKVVVFGFIVFCFLCSGALVYVGRLIEDLPGNRLDASTDSYRQLHLPDKESDVASKQSSAFDYDGYARDPSAAISLSSEVTSRAQSADLSDGTRRGGAFVHIGKTAGSTLSVLLRDGCHSFVEHPCRVVPHESMASHRISWYYHVPDFGLLSDSRHEFYVVSVRDPFDRTISSFVYEHVLNRIARNETITRAKVPKYEVAYRCFPTLQAFVDYLGYNPRKFTYNYSRRSVNADSCSDLASAALYSRVKLFNHLYFSMDKIRTLLPPKSPIYVTRQEHLWDDWTSVNQALGQTTEIHIPVDSQVRSTATTSPLLPVQRTLSDMGRMMLCNAIREEYQAYFWFLQQAQNLQAADVEQSVAAAQKNCPIVDMQELLQLASTNRNGA